MENIIELKGATRIYRQGAIDVVAVDSLDLSIAKGEFTVLSGPSGSGKTTVLNMIGMLDVPTRGQVFFEGQDVSRLNRTALSRLRRDRIGFIFQAYNLIPVLTAYENAEMIMALKGDPPAKRRERVMALLEEVGLKGLESRRPDELSGGQQQRVAIARAMAAEPAVVLADEPTANVDSETAAAILNHMERLNAEHQVTFLFSTHDPLVMSRARRIIRLKDGHLDQEERR